MIKSEEVLAKTKQDPDEEMVNKTQNKLNLEYFFPQKISEKNPSTCANKQKKT